MYHHNSFGARTKTMSHLAPSSFDFLPMEMLALLAETESTEAAMDSIVVSRNVGVLERGWKTSVI